MALRRERELLRENFAAIVSHELKGPLSAVQQNMFVLEQELAGTASEDQKRRLDRMKTRIKDLLQLVDRWLRGMSVDIEAMKENYQPLAVSSAIEKAVESVLPQAVRKDIEIVTSVEESAGQVMGDEGALTEALVNVLGNAVKYSPTESKVSIAWERKDNQVVISVSDTGVGISEEDLPFIFNGLYRAKSAEGAESGLGVGLAISRRIIEAHDGSISVQSKLGEGSTFVITLPAIEG